MKKFLIIIILLLISPIYGKAHESNKLIYDIENVSVNSDEITFEGWAYVDRVNSLGGLNYDISIIAVRKSDKTNYDNISRDKKIVVKEDKYSGENKLYPSTCYRYSGAAGTCMQVHFGYYENITNKTGGSGTIKDGQPYASCSDDDTTSCIYYNPQFEISFDVKELSDTFGSDEFTFVIEINYEPIKIGISGNGCKFTNSGYTGCTIKNKNNKIYRYLTFNEKNVQNYESLSKLLTKVNVDFDTKFHFGTNYARLLNESATYKANANTYFIKDNRYTINNSRIGTKIDAGTGISSNLRLYELKTNNYSTTTSERQDIGAGNSNTAWAWSTWGIVTGDISMSINPVGEGPSDLVCNSSVNDGCSPISSVTEGCQKLISYVENSVNLNFDGCPESDEHDSSYSLQKVYTFDERNTLDMGDTFNNSYSPGLGLDYNFTFTRNINWSPGEKTYYYVEYSYKNSSNRCVVEKGYVNRSYLMSKGIDVSDEDSKINSALNSYLSEEHELSYTYPDSNDVTKTVNSGYINVPDYSGFSDGIEIIYTYDMLNAFIDRKNANVKYGSVQNNANYLDGGLKYYIPFNADVDSDLIFSTSINNSSLLNKNINLNSVCSLNITGGKLENYRYRVIDLFEPFPNVKPTLNGRSSNWYDLWSLDNDILINRYNDNSLEYTVNLNSNNIKIIRDYNDKSVLDNKYLYINADIKTNGESIFIGDNNGIFTRVNSSNYSALGEMGAN